MARETLAFRNLIFDCTVQQKGKNAYAVRCVEEKNVRETNLEIQKDEKGHVTFSVQGKVFQARYQKRGNEIWLWSPLRTFHIRRLPSPKTAAVKNVAERERPLETTVRAPMTGKILNIRMKEGMIVKKGAVLAILEAMKMEYKLISPCDGKITMLRMCEGDLVDLGAILVELTPHSAKK